MAETTLAERIGTVVIGIGQRQAEHMSRWAQLFVSLGRAQQAATSTEARHWLYQAETAEHSLCGDCETVGPLIEALDGDDTGSVDNDR